MKASLLLLLVFVSGIVVGACTLPQVKDASDKRRVVCEFIKDSGNAKAIAACQKGDTLEDIAAAYAGCER